MTKLSHLLFGGRAAKIIRDSDVPSEYPRQMMLCDGKEYFATVELHGRIFGGAFLVTMIDAPKLSRQHNYARTPQLFAAKILKSHDWLFIGQSGWRGNVLRHTDGRWLDFAEYAEQLDSAPDFAAGEGESWNWHDNPQQSLNYNSPLHHR